MFTQCEHCLAVFRINMREITVAKGQLRCGECHTVFDASKSLSTAMPETFTQLEGEYQKGNYFKKNSDNDNDNDNDTRLIKGIDRSSDGDFSASIKLKVTAASLAILLITQVLFNYRHIFFETDKYQPDKIQMLNHNVFAHPIESDVLLISASMENTAEHDQRYPILEVRLSDSQSKLVALRRFTPNEYLDNYNKEMLFKKNQASSLKLKIRDPGNQATRFQFDFL